MKNFLGGILGIYLIIVLFSSFLSNGVTESVAYYENPGIEGKTNESQYLEQIAADISPAEIKVSEPTDSINYYINSKGNQVQSPTYYNYAPSNATAQCGDGTYSFSQSRSGTCSHHDGVAHWL